MPLKGIIYAILGLGMTLLAVVAGIGMLYITAEQEWVVVEGKVSEPRFSNKDFIFELEDIDTTFQIVQNVLDFDSLAKKGAQNLLTDKPVVTVTAFHHPMWDSDGWLTIVGLETKENHLYLTPEQYKRAQRKAALWPFGVGLAMFLCFLGVVYFMRKGGDLEERTKKKILAKLKKAFGKVRVVHGYYLVKYKGKSFLLHHHIVIKVQKYGNANFLYWTLCQSSDFREDAKRVQRRDHAHNLTFGLRAKALKKAFERAITNNAIK